MGYSRLYCGRVWVSRLRKPGPVLIYIIANPLELFCILHRPGLAKNGDLDLSRVLEFRLNPLADISG